MLYFRSMSTIISAKELYKIYGDLSVLKGVSLDIKQGEVVAIVGPSGAGKTTLLQLLGTLDTPTKQSKTSITINNQPILNLSQKELSKFRNKNIGFIFQFHQLLPEFTALENVCIPAYIAGKSKAETEIRAIELLSFLGLKNRVSHKPSELSGGEQQRVAVARALINNPLIVFADEPSGNLDTESATHLHKLFFELRDKFGQTFVIVTHNPDLANMADRKIEMLDGKIV